MSYPIFLNISSMLCLVVGGGRVGLRKTLGLLEAGARVRVVDPSPLEDFYDLKKTGLFIEAREFFPSDLDGISLVFAASNDAALNRKLGEEAKKRGILCNIADAPDLSDFFLPSLVKRGDLSLAISTEGKSPALARKLRIELERQFDAAYIPFVRLLGEIRKEVLLSGHDPESHQEIFRSLAGGTLLSLIRENRLAEAAELVAPFTGSLGRAEKMIRASLMDESADKQGEKP